MGKLSNYCSGVSTALLLLMLLLGHIGAVFGKLEPIHHKWSRSEIMDGNGLYLLEWKVDQKDIVFTVTVNTRGFIGLGFSYKSERMSGSDLVLAWVDDRTGKPNVLVSVSIIFLHNLPSGISGIIDTGFHMEISQQLFCLYLNFYQNGK